MVGTRLPWTDGSVLETLAGITGIGWTTSLLGFLVTLMGIGNGVVSRLVTDPQSLLYVGAVCFVTTLGLDRLSNSRAED